MKKYLLIPLIMLAVSACNGNGSKSGSGAKEYELLTIAPENYEAETEFAAQIKGRQDIRIIPRVDGYLEEIRVCEGQSVRKGQILFIIDQVSYKAAVKTAEASLLQAEAQVDKAALELEGKQQLYAKNIVSDFELAQSKHDLAAANANMEAAKASLEAARNNLSFTELRSPSDGVIGNLPYRKGDYVGPSTQDGLTIVSDNQVMYVYFSLSEESIMDYISSFGSMEEARENMPHPQLMLSGNKRYNLEGTIESVSGIVDQNTGAVSARAVFPNPEGVLLSGGTARVLIPFTEENAIVIPVEATFEILDKIYVYKVVDGTAKAAMVKTEKLSDGKRYLVTEGLEAGDVIVAKGAGFVREGETIKKAE